MAGDDPRHVRPFADLPESGLLWLINAAVFHPRGFALAITVRDGEAIGWKLLGDGSEPWRYGHDMDAKFAAAEATLLAARGAVDGDHLPDPRAGA